TTSKPNWNCAENWPPTRPWPLSSATAPAVMFRGVSTRATQNETAWMPFSRRRTKVTRHEPSKWTVASSTGKGSAVDHARYGNRHGRQSGWHYPVGQSLRLEPMAGRTRHPLPDLATVSVQLDDLRMAY